VIPDPIPPPKNPVGVDLGVKNLATLSDMTLFHNPRALRRNLRKLKKLQRNLSRKKKGSRNHQTNRMHLAKIYLRIFNIRQDTLHKVTTYLAKNHRKIVIEDLNVSGMLKNRRLAQAIADVGLYEFRRQLEYKCKWYGSELIIAPRTYPSSKLCSNCGHKKNELALSEREYHCDECGLMIDRDLNAALNLVAVRLPETQNDCGEDVRLLESPNGYIEKQTSMKQEPNSILDPNV
jgi:putative transposase